MSSKLNLLEQRSSQGDVRVELGERSYPIMIESGLLGRSGAVQSVVGLSQCMIITNTTVAPLYLEQARQFVDNVFSPTQLDTLVLPDGEEHKHLDTMELIYSALLEKGHTRKTVLVAFGGGVVGDMVGFAAATYQRGVEFIQIPTTLLAQVDSSVGGKTGVNHPLGKNMIGAFHQPRAVLIDIATLETLQDRDFSAGMAEVVKYGLIWDQAFFEWLEANSKQLNQRDHVLLSQAVQRSCEIKAEVVRQDEKESGIRAILNLGHTFGHAIETATDYTAYRHGEAVAIGLVMALDLSQRLGWIEAEWCERTVRLLNQFDLPVACPSGIGAAKMLELMGRDKKVLDSRIRLVLLRACGQAVVTSEFDEACLNEMLAEI